MRNLQVPRITMALTLGLATVSVANARTDSDLSSAPATFTQPATYMAGLNNVKIGAKGDLRITKRSIDFESENITSSLPLDEIVAVYTGDERAEKGGTAGEVVRKLPYGAGHVAGAAMQTSVDLLTLEYHDRKGGIHGAVFIVPQDEAEAIKQRINPELISYSEKQPKKCSAPDVLPESILVNLIDVQGVDVPAEYRLLIYERLITDLQHKLIGHAVYRSGDAAAGSGCMAQAIDLTLTGFSKGNEAERGTAGVFGLFVGATSISYRLKLHGSHGAVLLDEPLKGSRRGDHESLTLADSVAKTIAQKVDKAIRESTNGSGKQA
jgi:hypothetical protein